MTSDILICFLMSIKQDSRDVSDADCFIRITEGDEVVENFKSELHVLKIPLEFFLCGALFLRFKLGAVLKLDDYYVLCRTVNRSSGHICLG